MFFYINYCISLKWPLFGSPREVRILRHLNTLDYNFRGVCRLGGWEYLWSSCSHHYRVVCIFFNGVKNGLTQYRVADVHLCLMLAITVHSHSPTEQVDERGSDAVTAGSPHCAVSVVLFCRHTAFFSLSCSLPLCRSFSPSFTASWLSPWRLQVWITSCLG